MGIYSGGIDKWRRQHGYPTTKKGWAALTRTEAIDAYYTEYNFVLKQNFLLDQASIPTSGHDPPNWWSHTNQAPPNPREFGVPAPDVPERPTVQPKRKPRMPQRDRVGTDATQRARSAAILAGPVALDPRVRKSLLG